MMNEQKLNPLRVRLAPSPTGHTHIGSGRTALYNYLLARQTGGQFILRIEDTDQKRYVPGAEQELMDSLRWLGLDWDEGPDCGGPHTPYRQSSRREIYQDFAARLVKLGHAYPCFCTPQRLAEVRAYQQKMRQPVLYDGACRRLDPDDTQRRIANADPHVIRFKTPKEGSITVFDRLRGSITIMNETIDDYILVKSDGLALYHLAAMVDDHLMGITHVLRGVEWLSTFPLHAHIIRAFGWQEPVWVHLSVFLKPSGKGKMSKRETASLMKDGYSIFIKDLESLGYIPEAVNNWIALMGWSYDDHTEFFRLQDLVEKFSLDNLNPAPAAINFTKFDYFNGLHIRRLPVKDLAIRLRPFFNKAGLFPDEETLRKITPLIQERMVTLDDAIPMAGFFFRDDVQPNLAELRGKNMDTSDSAAAASQALHILECLPEIDQETAEQKLRDLATTMGLNTGQLFGILRVAITGQAISPPLFESMAVIGRTKVLQRLRNAIKRLETATD